MGNEAVCTLRYAGKLYSGRALLETTELLFRGEFRLKLPLASVKKAQAKNGALHLTVPGGVAVLELGSQSQAEKWRDKILHPKSLIEKLGVKAGDTVKLEGKFAADFLASIRKQGAAVANGRKSAPADWIFLLADSLADLRRLPAIATSLEGAAALWIVYPKGQKSITESDVRSAGLKCGLTDIKVASFSSSHTALKFVIPVSRR